MLTRIKLENFKCFRELELKCAPLTLLTGINGTGKSSVFQALILLRKSFEAQGLENGRLLVAGDPIDFGSATDLLHSMGKSVGLALEHDQLEQVFFLPEGVDQPTESYDEQFELSQTSDQLVQPVDWDLQSLYSENVYSVPPFSGNFVFVSADRLGPERTYVASEIASGFFPKFGESAWNYLYNNQWHLFDEQDVRCIGNGAQRLIDETNQWLHSICPGARIELDHIDVANLISAEFAFDGSAGQAPKSFRPTNVGFGLSYTLPVIVALLMPTGSFCLIENPEAHLHPSGQTKMAELAARAAKAGVQVMVETHSDHFIDGIRIAVREGILTPDDVAIHYFERQGNESVVRSPVIDSDGRLSEWPAGFFDQHEMNAVRLLGPRNA